MVLAPVKVFLLFWAEGKGLGGRLVSILPSCASCVNPPSAARLTLMFWAKPEPHPSLPFTPNHSWHRKKSNISLIFLEQFNFDWLKF